MSASVIVYNLGTKEINCRVDLHHAIKMVHKGKARIVETIRGEKFGPFDMPKALELLKYIHAKWRYNKTGVVPYSRIGVLRRDGFTCCYCGIVGSRAEMTVDHVLPKWQGNAASWNNSVTACRPCNQKKGGNSPKEAGMPMLFKPRTPTFHEAYDWQYDLDR
jgi:Restriction endonuclease